MLFRSSSVDVRISTLPTQYGESIVMRLLNQNTGLLGLDRLGLPAETLRQFGSIMTDHHAASRSPMRSTGKRSSTLARIDGPEASVGTKKRSFHEMISLKRP